jgi:hypothetical protein
MFERIIVRKNCGYIKEEETWRIRTNKEIQKIIQGAGIVKFIKSVKLRCYRRTERMNNGRMRDQIGWKERGKKEDHGKDGLMRLKRIRR